MITQEELTPLYTSSDFRRRTPPFTPPPVLPKKAFNDKKGFQPRQRLYSGRVYPNGEFGVGFLPREKKKIADKRYDQREVGDLVGGTYDLVTEVVPQSDGTILYTKEKQEIFSPKLGSGSQSSQPRKKYGRKGLTGYGKKMIRNSGYVIDMACKGRYGALPQMGTLTVPSYGPDEMLKISCHWAEITRRFFQKCKRRYAKLALRFDYVSCTEIQPERWAERREVGLHLHFLFVAYRFRKDEWSLPDEWVRASWKSCLEYCLGGKTYVGRVNYRREAVRRSSSAYLAKYISKGDEQIKEVVETYGESVLPSQWWSVSSRVRQCIKSATCLCSEATSAKLCYMAKENITEYIMYVRAAQIFSGDRGSYDIPYSGQFMVVGYGGRLSSEGMRVIDAPDTRGCIVMYLPVPLTAVD